MLVARDSNNEEKLAWITERNEAPFYCPECEDEVRLRKGKIRAHHFAHIPPVTCQYGTGESEIHHRAKRDIYEALLRSENCSKCALERQLGDVRPDISLFINRVPVAIEIQKSSLSIDEIYRRVSSFTKQNIYILWVIPTEEPKTKYRERDKVDVHRLLEWEKYIHALYYGNIYYWQGGSILKAFHFSKFEISTDYNEWYSPDGELMSAGGHSYTAKALKTVDEYYDELEIANDFEPFVRRENFHTNKWTIGKFRIYRSKVNNWW